MDYKQIIERLSYLRTKKNLSSRAFGQMLGHSDTYFYKVENGSIIISLPQFIEMLDALEITPAEFFYPDIENYKRDMEVLNLTKSLSKEELEALTMLLKRK